MIENKKARQYFSLILSLLVYYILHEGAHFVVASYLGVFKCVRFLGLGIQIDVYSERMTQTEMGIFCVAGSIVTLITSVVLVALTQRICLMKSKTAKAFMYYLTITLLTLDPTYLSVLYDLFGGGDMNGIKFLLPETTARITYGLLLIVNTTIVFKYIIPTYSKAFKPDKAAEK